MSKANNSVYQNYTLLNRKELHMAREKIAALGKKMTDRIPQKLGLAKITEDDPEYYGLECVVSDEEADVALAMDVRKPTTPEKLAAKMGKDVAYVRKIMDDLAFKGVLEYNYDTPDGSRQYVLPIFVLHHCYCQRRSRQLLYWLFYILRLSSLFPPYNTFAKSIFGQCVVI